MLFSGFILRELPSTSEGACVCVRGCVNLDPAKMDQFFNKETGLGPRTPCDLGRDSTAHGLRGPDWPAESSGLFSPSPRFSLPPSQLPPSEPGEQTSLSLFAWRNQVQLMRLGWSPTANPVWRRGGPRDQKAKASVCMTPASASETPPPEIFILGVPEQCIKGQKKKGGEGGVMPPRVPVGGCLGVGRKTKE